MARNADCRLCPLHEKATTVCVWGEWRGDLNWLGPRVMVVGQSPGGQEDRDGHPFIGRSGGLLDEGMHFARLPRYYVTNAAKCSPEVNNETIDRSHWSACADYLDEEIEQVKPDFILALGNPAVQRLLGFGKVSDISGKEIWSARYQAWVVPAFHPAAILRALGRKPAWLADIGRFGSLVRGDIHPPPSVPPVSVELVETETQLRGLGRLLLTEPRVSFDFEANAPDKKLPGWCDVRFRPYTIAFSFTGQEAYCVPLAHPDVDRAWSRLALGFLRNLKPLFSKPGGGHGIWKTVHNLIYDALVWYRLTGYLPYIDCDTMPMLHILDENRLKNLKWAGRTLLGWPDWDINARKLWPLQKLYPYNGYDAAASYEIEDVLMPQLWEDEQLTRYWHQLEMPKLRMLARMVANGLHVDRSRVAHNMLSAWHRQQTADAAIAAASKGIIKNPGSDAQVARWLYDELRLHEKVAGIRHGKKHYTTDEETIKRLAKEGHTAARLILACRRPRKEISTYYRPVGRATRISFDRRSHPDIRTTSVETGRLASPFHTTPRPEESVLRGEPAVRPIYAAPPGFSLLQFDYRQIEARLCAWSAAGRPETWDDFRDAVSAGRANMLLAFFQKREIYREQAAEGIYGPGQGRIRWRDVDKNQRQVMGKVPVLAMLYRISPPGLQEYAWKEYEIEWTLRQATGIHAAFHRLWPEYGLWHRLEEAKLRSRGYARSPIGRLRRLPGAMYGQSDDIRAGINAPIQSLASDFTQEAGILVDQDIEAAEARGGLLAGAIKMVGDIHDALLIQCRNDVLPQVARQVRRRMLEAPVRLRTLGCRIPPGLIEVEVTVGSWGEGKEITFGNPAPKTGTGTIKSGVLTATH